MLPADDAELFDEAKRGSNWYRHSQSCRIDELGSKNSRAECHQVAMLSDDSRCRFFPPALTSNTSN